MNVALERVLAQLPDAKRNASEWTARCPAHEDRDPSLSIGEGKDGAVLLHCHARCTPEDVVAALGLTMSDLFETPLERTKPSIGETYDYVAEDGTVLYQVVRMVPKDFRQRRPDGEGWAWRLGDTRRVLYRLPQVVAQVAARKHVLVVEGEKDVHQLEALGFVATTNSGGAGKWRDEYSESLRGACVVILPDNDEPGRRHAQQVAAALSGVAAEVRVIELPNLPSKGDVSDWLAAGGTAAELEGLIATKKTQDFLDELFPADRTHDVRVESVDSVNIRSGLDPEWEQPLRLDTPAGLPSFPVHALPPVLREFVTEVAESRQVPADMPALAALGVLAACTAGRYHVELPTHTEPCNLYLLCGAEPGTRKSQTMRDATAPLHAAEAYMVDEAKPSVDGARAARDVAEARAKHLQARAAKSDDPTERQVMQRELADLLGSMADPVALPRLTFDDATPERVAQLLAENRGALAMLSAEGGIVGMMAGRYSDRSGPNLDVYLKAHAGDPLRVDRASGRTLHLKHPALTLCLMVQPHVFRELADVQGGRGRGLLGRFLYSLPQPNLGNRAYRSRAINPQVSSRYGALVAAMLAQPLEDEPRPLSLRGAALTLWVDFYSLIEERQQEGGDLRPIADWASKAAGAVARIAGCLHAADYAHGRPDGVPIAPETVAAAVAIGDYFVHHALAAFGVMGDSPIMARARSVVAWLDRHGRTEFSLRDLHQHIRADSPADLLPALRLLEERSIIQELPAPPRSGAGRKPSARYAVNPNLENRSQNSQNDSLGSQPRHCVNCVNESVELKSEEPEPTEATLEPAEVFRL